MGTGSVTPPPEAEPVVPVPQEDDPKSIENTKEYIERQKERKGFEASLLAGDGDYRGDTRDPHTNRKAIQGMIK